MERIRTWVGWGFNFCINTTSCSGCYVEIDIRANSPNDLYLGFLDYDNGECSSLEFNPASGVIFMDTSPCGEVTSTSDMRLQRKSLHLLQPCAEILLDDELAAPFTGLVGMYICGEDIAFFRRSRWSYSSKVYVSWETTGLLKNLVWAARVRPFLFVDEPQPGYRASITKVSQRPPFLPAPRRILDSYWNG